MKPRPLDSATPSPRPDHAHRSGPAPKIDKPSGPSARTTAFPKPLSGGERDSERDDHGQGIEPQRRAHARFNLGVIVLIIAAVFAFGFGLSMGILG